MICRSACGGRERELVSCNRFVEAALDDPLGKEALAGAVHPEETTDAIQSVGRVLDPERRSERTFSFSNKSAK